jgi:uncharacterized protein (DUF1684 family)
MKKLLLFNLVVLYCHVSSAQDKSPQLFQERINSEYSNKKVSPLTDLEFDVFETLPFYEINKKLRIKAKFILIENGSAFRMKTNTNRRPKYIRYALAKFKINKKEYELTIYQNVRLSEKEEYAYYLFLPFTDLTNGSKTYGGGRYLDLRIPKKNKIIIDFNQAYNPHCAYNGKYSCPIVPEENALNIEIEAGVMYEDKYDH